MQKTVWNESFSLPLCRFLIYLLSSGSLVIEDCFFIYLVNSQKFYVCNKKDPEEDRRMLESLYWLKDTSDMFLYKISAVEQSFVLPLAFFPGTFSSVGC